MNTAGFKRFKKSSGQTNRHNILLPERLLTANTHLQKPCFLSGQRIQLCMQPQFFPAASSEMNCELKTYPNPRCAASGICQAPACRQCMRLRIRRYRSLGRNLEGDSAITKQMAVPALKGISQRFLHQYRLKARTIHKQSPSTHSPSISLTARTSPFSANSAFCTAPRFPGRRFAEQDHATSRRVLLH